MESSKAFSDWIVLFKVNMCGFLSSQELQWNPSALRSASVCFKIERISWIRAVHKRSRRVDLNLERWVPVAEM